jgi:hypothetical protein
VGGGKDAEIKGLFYFFSVSSDDVGIGGDEYIAVALAAFDDSFIPYILFTCSVARSREVTFETFNLVPSVDKSSVRLGTVKGVVEK